jgi:hypothetical protein
MSRRTKAQQEGGSLQPTGFYDRVSTCRFQINSKGTTGFTQPMRHSVHQFAADRRGSHSFSDFQGSPFDPCLGSISSLYGCGVHAAIMSSVPCNQSQASPSQVPLRLVPGTNGTVRFVPGTCRYATLPLFYHAHRKASGTCHPISDASRVTMLHHAHRKASGTCHPIVSAEHLYHSKRTCFLVPQAPRGCFWLLRPEGPI